MKSNSSTPAQWIQEHFWIPELRGPIHLEPYQVDCVNEALSRDENGNFKYSIIVWSDIKKSIKSCIAAAVALMTAEDKEWGEVYIIANDLEQADSRVAGYVRRSIDLNKEFTDKYRQKGYTLTNRRRTKIQAIPIDPSGEAGSNADAIIFSELWGANEDAKQRMWSELTLSPTKFGQSFRWIESYAGFTDESELLFSLYTQGKTNGHLLWPERLYHDNINGESVLQAYANPEARMFCLWNNTPRLPWQSNEYYASEAAVLTDGEFRRMHRNEWVTSEEAFVPEAWWDACKRDEFPVIVPNTSKIVVMDAGIASDTFGLVMGYRHPENEHDVVIEYARKWIPPKGGRLDFQGTDEQPGPELELRRLCKENNVIMVAYDEYQLADMAKRLSREGLAWFRRFSQGSDRLVADSMLRDSIRNRSIWHNGNPDLREHVLNANAKTDEKEDRKIRIVKRNHQLKIDLCVCASMLNHSLRRLNL